MRNITHCSFGEKCDCFFFHLQEGAQRCFYFGDTLSTNESVLSGVGAKGKDLCEFELCHALRLERNACSCPMRRGEWANRAWDNALPSLF